MTRLPRLAIRRYIFVNGAGANMAAVVQGGPSSVGRRSLGIARGVTRAASLRAVSMSKYSLRLLG